jgi:hypothetical protein
MWTARLSTLLEIMVKSFAPGEEVREDEVPDREGWPSGLRRLS